MSAVLRRAVLRRAALMLSVALSATSALSPPKPLCAAGGLFNAPHGAEATGAAGAVVAGAATLNGAWYNPALLADLPTTSALIDLTLTQPNFSYTRASRYNTQGQLQTFGEVHNSAPPTLAPQLGLAHSFGLKRWRFAISGFAPNGVASTYPERGPQRYQLIDTQGSLVWMTSVSVAWRPHERFWVGASLVNTSLKLRQVLMASAYPGFLGAADDPAFDALVDTQGSSLLNLTAQLGLRASALKVGEGEVSVGASLWLPTEVTLSELSLKQRLPSHPLFDGAYVEGERASMSVTLPMIARFGVRYSAPQYALELNGVYEDHSDLQALTSTPQGIYVRDVAGGLDFEIGATSIPRLFRATWSARLGGEWRPTPQWLTRLGLAWEQSASPDEALTIAAMDSEKWTLALGASWSASPSLWLDMGYAFTHLSDRVITQSVLKQVNPLNEEGAISVGEGLYRGALHMLSLGVRWGADPSPSPSPSPSPTPSPPTSPAPLEPERAAL